MSWSRVTRLVALGAVGALTACGAASSSPSQGNKSPYSVYFISDLTGVTASIGQPQLSGTKAYIDWANKQGGVNGHKINLTTLDDGQDVQKVKVDVQQAASADALAIVGANSSNGWSPNASFIQQQQITTIGLGFTDPQIDPNPPYLFLTSPSYLQMATMDFNFITDQLIKHGLASSNPRIGFYHYTSAAVSTMITYYKQIMQTKGWQLTSDQSFAQNATDTSSQATALVQGKTDVVVANLIDSIAPLAVRTLREKGFTGPVVNFSGASSPATFSALKDPGYYSLRIFYATTDTDQPGITEIVRRARAVGDTDGMNNLYWSFGYAQAAAILAGIKKCGDSCDRVKFSDTLQSAGKVDLNGLNPDAQLTPTRHRLATNGVYFQWDNGKGREVPVGGFVSGT